MLYKIDSTTRVRVFTEQEKEDSIFVKTKVHEIANKVRSLDANTLRQIEKLILGNKRAI